MDISFEQFITHFGANDTSNLLVLTANQRQARHLKQSLSKGLNHVGAAANIQPMNDWLTHCWSSCQDQGYDNFSKKLLSPIETVILWEQALNTAKDMPALIDRSRLAQQLQKAYEICTLYRIPMEELIQSGFNETQFFLNTREIFQRLLTNTHTITHEDAAATLKNNTINHLDTKQIYLFGFAEIPPLLIDLTAQLSTQPPITIKPSQQNSTCQFHTAPTAYDEIQIAANWAKDTLAHASADEDIIIVVPDLSAQLDRVQTIFLKTLEPERYLYSTDTIIPSVYDISASHPLDQIKIIEDSINLLSLLGNKIKRQSAEKIMLSEYWGEGFNQDRARLLKHIRAQAQPHLSIATLLAIQNHTNHNADIHHGHDESEAFTHDHTFTHIINAKQSSKQAKSYTAWINWLTEFLYTAGWPGKRTLSSYEYQCTQVFINMLENINKLDAIYSEPVSFSAFKNTLNVYCANTPSHPEVKAPRIRIMGLMEASGLSVEHCYVTGLTENTLPQSPRPHPFIPIDIQRTFNAPKSSPERELFYSEQLLNSLVSSSKNIVLSYASEDEKGPQLPSPLVNQLTHDKNQTIEIVNAQPTVFDQHINNALAYDQHISVATDTAPSIIENEKIAGGAYHLNAFWVNPMYAFFKYRLGMIEQQTNTLGLNFAQRGSLVHDCLAAIYQQHPSKGAIENLLNHDDVENYIQTIAQQCMNTMQRHTHQLPSTLFNYELARLTSTSLHFIKQDAQRNQAFEVRHIETKSDIEICNRIVSIRYDRIDYVENKAIVIDYKTGKTTLSPLIKQTITDFQLPLYAYGLSDTELSAVCYVEVNENGAEFKGVGDNNITINGIVAPNKPRFSELNESFHDALSVWKSNIDQRVLELCSGFSEYQPRDKTKQSHFDFLSSAIRAEEREHYNDSH